MSLGVERLFNLNSKTFFLDTSETRQQRLMKLAEILAKRILVPIGY